MRTSILLFIFLIFGLITITAQQNPMFSNDNSAEDSTSIENTIIENEKTINHVYIQENFIKKHYNNFLRNNNRRQAILRSKIVSTTHEIKDKSSSSSYIWILLFSLVYGIAHSLGPGHNKVLIFSYFIGENANIKQGLILGNLMSFIHALSGLITVSIITYIIKESASSYDNSTALLYIQKASFSLIIIIGILLLIGHTKEYLGRNNKQKAINTNKSILPMAIGLGIVPCPGTMILVSFLGIAGLGYLAPLAALFMAIGMAITISSIGILTIISKKFILKVIKSNTGIIRNIQFSMSIIGSLLIIGFGLLFVL